MPTYITAVAAGPYHVVRDEHDGIPLGVYCRQSLASYLDADEILEVTRQGFDFYHSSFGIKYPFGKYDQLFVPEFKEGAMENAGCVTFVEAYIFRSRVTDFAREARGETILHEMAHMWFGDLVTMRWWDDLWLNESFATWAGTLAQAEATRWTSAWTTFAQVRQFGGQARLGQRGRDRLPVARRLLVVEARAERGVQRAEHLGSVGLLRRDQHPDGSRSRSGSSSRYCSGMSSLPSFSTDRLITCQVTLTWRTFCTSRIQREVIQAHGQIGSNQKSTRVGSCSVSSCGVMRTVSDGRPRKFRRRDDHPVTSDNLTRDEAATRSALITVASYQVDLDLTVGDATFGSVSVVRFGCAAPGSATFINLTAPAVREITLNDAPVGLDAFDGNRITLTGLAAENVLRVAADCAYSRSGEGLHRFTDPADGRVYLYSDLETFDAHRIYACFDQPDMKASYQLAVTAPADWEVVSNMAAESTVAAGSVPGGGTLRWHFPPTPVMPTYITAVAAGPYHVVRGEHDGIPLGVYCRQSLAEYLDADEILEVTRQGFDFYHSSFGIKYPFGKYDQLFVPEFKEGAMENAGCVTFVEAIHFPVAGH